MSRIDLGSWVFTEDIVNFSSFSQWEMESRSSQCVSSQPQRNMGTGWGAAVGLFPHLSPASASHSPWPTSPCSTVSSPVPPYASWGRRWCGCTWHSQLVWELISSLPVSGWVLKAPLSPGVIHPFQPLSQPTHPPLHLISRDQIIPTTTALLIAFPFVINEAILCSLC